MEEDSVVPIIDVSALNGSDHEAKLEVAKQIGTACEEIGFLVITNHGIPQEVIDTTWAQTFEFFDSPFEQKNLMCPDDQATYPYGYSPVGGELLSRGKEAEQDENVDQQEESVRQASHLKVGDLKEMMQMGPANPLAGMPPRRWPEEPANLKGAWESYYEECNKLARRLLGAFALALDLPEDWFESKLDRHVSALRAVNYPDQKGMEVPAGAIRASAHTDYGTLTILRTGGPGLQVSKDNGSNIWYDVPLTPNCLIINLGDLMRRWTNERWVSTLHRVINPTLDQQALWGRRLAIAFFHNLNKDAMVEAIPSCVSEDRPSLYDPIVAHEFLMLKHLASQGEVDPDAHFKRKGASEQHKTI